MVGNYVDRATSITLSYLNRSQGPYEQTVSVSTSNHFTHTKAKVSLVHLQQFKCAKAESFLG